MIYISTAGLLQFMRRSERLDRAAPINLMKDDVSVGWQSEGFEMTSRQNDYITGGCSESALSTEHRAAFRKNRFKMLLRLLFCVLSLSYIHDLFEQTRNHWY